MSKNCTARSMKPLGAEANCGMRLRKEMRLAMCLLQLTLVISK